MYYARRSRDPYPPGLHGVVTLFGLGAPRQSWAGDYAKGTKGVSPHEASEELAAGNSAAASNKGGLVSGGVPAWSKAPNAPAQSGGGSAQSAVKNMFTQGGGASQQRAAGPGPGAPVRQSGGGNFTSGPKHPDRVREDQRQASAAQRKEPPPQHRDSAREASRKVDEQISRQKQEFDRQREAQRGQQSRRDAAQAAQERVTKQRAAKADELRRKDETSRKAGGKGDANVQQGGARVKVDGQWQGGQGGGSMATVGGWERKPAKAGMFNQGGYDPNNTNWGEVAAQAQALQAAQARKF